MADKERVIRISPDKLKTEFLRVLLKSGFSGITGRKTGRNIYNEQHGWS